MFKKEIIEKNHLAFEKLKAEDTIFNIDFYNYANRVAIIDSYGYCYRQNKASLTSLGYKKDLFQQSKISYEVQKNKLISMRIFDITKNRLSRQFFVDTRECLCRELSTISGKNKKEALQAMKKIMSDPFLQKIINEYPVNQIGWEQRIFLRLLKIKNKKLMYFFINLYVLKNME